MGHVYTKYVHANTSRWLFPCSIYLAAILSPFISSAFFDPERFMFSISFVHFRIFQPISH